MTSVGAHFSLQTSSSNVIFSIEGNFNFEGIACSFDNFAADIHIEKMSDMISAIIGNIENDAKQVFDDLLIVAEEWASKISQAIITEIESVAKVLQNAFEQDAKQIATTMKNANFDLGTITGDIKQIFDPE